MTDTAVRTPKAERDEDWIREAQLASNSGTFRLDFQNERWEWTPQIAVLLGLDPGTTGGRFADWEKAVFADDVGKLRAAIKSATAGGTLYVELRVRREDGVHWLAGCGRARSGEDGKPRWLLGSFFEITDRKVLEARLLALNETLEARIAERGWQLETRSVELRESENRFRLLVEAATDYAMFLLDSGGNVVTWNPGAERIKGYSASEIIGQHFSRFYTKEDQKAGTPMKLLTGAKATGRSEAEGWRVRKDGTRFWANIVIAAIHDPAGDIIGFAKITRYLTERRNAEDRMRQAQTMEAIGQLTGGVAHDFNNLLTVISGNLETVLRRLPKGAPDLTRPATAALRGAMRAGALTHQLLAFARRQALEPKAVALNDLAMTMSQILRRTLGENILVETVLDNDLWPAFADINQLENAVLNLAINSRDAMPEGGKLTIEAANVYLDDAAAGAVD
ncbi:MAG: PAS domain S-box protein, partial [Stellaceae bacterium]